MYLLSIVPVGGVTVAVLLLLAIAGIEVEADGVNGGWLMSTQFNNSIIIANKKIYRLKPVGTKKYLEAGDDSWKWIENKNLSKRESKINKNNEGL